ncbi:MAG: hypothetical protein CVT49_08015 [candidate division Zixibacteria bacterium HGW-Zixibacteria-1]|nr:MAG: hypothetical protein CVT49_08015 [candidate division Zixibacteria bacterium HGW-Zixibacteria-1]
MIKILGTDGTQFYSLQLKPGKYHVGRNPDSELSIRHKTVSRNHAEIHVNEDGAIFSLLDLDSRNGTFVNGNQIRGRVPIKIGDKIMFGHTEFRLETVSSEDEAASAKPGLKFSETTPQNSVFLSIEEALKPMSRRTTEERELLPTIFEMAKMLVMSDPREVMLEKSLGMIAGVIPAERLAVLFVSADGDIYPAAKLLPGGRDPGEFRLSRTIINQIITQKSAIRISDPLQDPLYAQQQSIIMSELKSAMAAPLFDEGKVLGILYVDTNSPRHHYSDEHLRILATFGNIIASRLLNYELLEEREQKQIIDAELSRASGIQKNLLVTNPPETKGYRLCTFQEQSRSVGGDLYDVSRLPDGRTLFLLADVSGKGMGAALLMANILASFRILYDSSDFDLCRAVRRVSEQMYKFSDPGDFATLMIGLLDPNSNQVRYVNAGHNHPLLVRSGGEIEYLPDTGIVIGVIDGIAWEEKTVQLNNDDLIFIFTDGVTEAQRDDEQYGDKRMEDIVVATRDKIPRETVDILMKDINDFMGDAPRSDDITILAIKKVEE